jgi:hypothetical protein
MIVWLAAPTIASAASDFGPWYPAPGSGNAACASTKQSDGICSPYQSNLVPTSNDQVSEVANFTCLYSNGTPVDDHTLLLLTQIFQQGFNVFEGNGVEARDVGTAASDKDHKIQADDYNGSGPQALASFLTSEGNALKGAYWMPYNKRDIGSHGQYAFGGTSNAVASADPDNGKSDNNSGQPDSELVDTTSSLYQNRTQAGNFITDAVATYGNQINPLTMTSSVPAGCGLQVFTVSAPSFGELFSSPGEFFTDMIFYIPGNLTQSAYNFIQPKAFTYTFWTPHTERGDTFFNVTTNCSLGTSATSAASNPNNGAPTTTSLNDGDEQTNAAQVQDDCYNGTPLGFSQARLKPVNQTAWYIDLAHFFQWILSGTYFLILFTAAVVYMVRGNRSTSFNVLQLIPRLLLSALLTIFISEIIGVAITTSDLITKSLLDYSAAGSSATQSLNVINNILLRTGFIFQGFGADFSQFIQIVVGAVTVFFFFVFVIEALIRQFVLMGVIIFAPVACFCLIVPRWQPRFGFFVRILLTICMIPALMALVFRLGTAMNPIINDPTDLSSGAAAIGVFMFVLTLYLMGKIFKLGRSYISQGGMPNSMGAGMLGGAGSRLQQAGASGYGGKYGSAALRGLGAGALGGAAAAEAFNSSLAPLVPRHKGMMAGSGPQLRQGRQMTRQAMQTMGLPVPAGAAAGAAGSAAGAANGAAGARMAGAGRGRGGSLTDGAAANLGEARGLQGSFENHLIKRQAERGERRVPLRQVQQQRLAYQKQVNGAVQAEEQRLGRRLKGTERGAVVSNLKDRNGKALQEPQFTRRGGSYFVQDAAMKRPSRFARGNGQTFDATGQGGQRRQRAEAPTSASGQRSSNTGAGTGYNRADQQRANTRQRPSQSTRAANTTSSRPAPSNAGGRSTAAGAVRPNPPNSQSVDSMLDAHTEAAGRRRHRASSTPAGSGGSSATTTPTKAPRSGPASSTSKAAPAPDRKEVTGQPIATPAATPAAAPSSPKQ